MVNEAIGGNYNQAILGLQSSVLAGFGVDIKVAGSAHIDASPTLTWDLKGKGYTTTKYAFKSAREEATALERVVQVGSDNLDAVFVNESVRTSYRMTVGGSYAVIGGATQPELKFSTGNSQLQLAADTISQQSPRIILGGRKAEVYLNYNRGVVEIDADDSIDLTARKTIYLKASGQARFDANTVRIG